MSSHAPDHVPDTASPSRAPRGRARLIAATVAIAVAIVAVDQLTKYLAQHNLVVGAAPVQVVGNLIKLQLIYNSGAALSIGTGVTWVLTIVVLIVIAVIIWAIRRIGSRGWAIALGLLLGGAVGNLIDRLAREPGFGRGHVVDFIGYGSLFVGNVADIAIVAAAVMIGVLAVLGVGITGERTAEAPRHLRAEEANEEASGLDGPGADGTNAPGEPTADPDGSSSDEPRRAGPDPS